MALSTLKQRYFSALPAYDEETAIEFIIDGACYLLTIYDEVALTQGGDCVYIVGWFFEPTMDLAGKRPDDPDRLALGDLLAMKAAQGVDVRIVLNGAQYLGAFGAPGYGTCYEAMKDLQTRVPPGSVQPPLANRILYDWSGAELTGSNHQKATVIRRRGQLIAFLGGIDFNPLMLDAPPHNSQTLPGTGGVQWGWHDGGIRLEGGAAAAVYENFADRWLEASTLPTATLFVKDVTHKLPRFIRYTPPSTSPVCTFTEAPSATPTVKASVQILRSRFKTKLNRPFVQRSWQTAGGGELTQVFQTLSRALDGAQRYIYIEDQFLADHPPLPGPALLDRTVWSILDFVLGSGRLGQFSLFSRLKAALSRGVHVVMVGSGYADPGDLIPGPKNRTMHPQLADLARTNAANLAVWRIEGTTVHTKLILVDDVFVAIGSANMQSRSMIGIDSELQAAVVDDGNLVQVFRARLWAEHLGLDYLATSGALRAALDDLDIALGMWRAGWGPGGGAWFTDGVPADFTPATMSSSGSRTRVVRAYVGPGNHP